MLHLEPGQALAPRCACSAQTVASSYVEGWTRGPEEDSVASPYPGLLSPTPLCWTGQGVLGEPRVRGGVQLGAHSWVKMRRQEVGGSSDECSSLAVGEVGD